MHVVQEWELELELVEGDNVSTQEWDDYLRIPLTLLGVEITGKTPKRYATWLVMPEVVLYADHGRKEDFLLDDSFVSCGGSILSPGYWEYTKGVTYAESQEIVQGLRTFFQEKITLLHEALDRADS
jgi:hypothetical protein